jgi:hypothetical protein
MFAIRNGEGQFDAADSTPIRRRWFDAAGSTLPIRRRDVSTPAGK